MLAPLPQSWSEQLAPVTIHPFMSHVGPTVAIPDFPYSSWTKITREELKAFIGFSILMGINRLPSVDDYWSKDPLLHYSPISNKIPRWRFREISRYLHFVNNEDLAPRGDPMHDWLDEVQFVV